ncbi:MAG: hypothetical protein A2359_02130 [Candidatus Moranbacteria bacterium RIFOXYB1_FULL_43_19]|nr:MAG: hypothetical protein A2359_02130 [Candidatus Moranbacteria bacterium RIFOXYB1_FULL_43_19]
MIYRSSAFYKYHFSLEEGEYGKFSGEMQLLLRGRHQSRNRPLRYVPADISEKEEKKARKKAAKRPRQSLSASLLWMKTSVFGSTFQQAGSSSKGIRY